MSEYDSSFDSFSEDDIRPDRFEKMRVEAYVKDLDWLRSKLDTFVDVPCPACCCNRYTPRFKKELFTFVECEKCGTVYMSPRPLSETMAEYYKISEHYRVWAKYIFPASENSRKALLYRTRVERLRDICAERNISNPRIVEVGGGSGSFAEVANQSGFFEDIVVIEPTPDLANTCREKNLTVIERCIEEVSPEMINANVIVSFEVIEHLIDPGIFLQQVSRVLAPGGLLVLSCPNAVGFDTILLEGLSNAYSWDHVNLFTIKSLPLLLEYHGFGEIKIETPGRLDAELVRKAALSGEYTLNNRFLERILLEEWDLLGSKFQKFLADNLLSSHMWAQCLKNA